jgi:hypothetical protein
MKIMINTMMIIRGKIKAEFAVRHSFLNAKWVKNSENRERRKNC